MLRELHISNLAVIEDVTVELGEGLNCFTGQTGAGKSLILTAFEVLLGLRTGAGDMLRPGAQEARITGVFEVHDPAIARSAGAILDQTLASGDALLVTRKFFASGRSTLAVNAQPATAAMVRALGELLVDIHGQHDHQYLLKPGNQLTILDAFARCGEQREEFAALHAQLRQGLRRREELTASRTLRRQQLELYEFQAQEIDTAGPQPGEFEQLKARHLLLTNLEKVRREAGLAFNALYESEGSIVERLQMVAHVLASLAELDKALNDVSEQVRTCALTLQESAFELGRYTDKMDFDPRELAEVDDRLNTLNRLIAKYASSHGTPGPDALAEVFAHRQTIGREIDLLRTQNEDLEQIEGRIADVRREMEAVGKRLSESRRAAARKLKPLAEAQLRDLGMGEAEFEVEFQAAGADSGDAAEAAGEKGDESLLPGAAPGKRDSSPFSPQGAGRATGLESLEMMVRTNPGQPARPLRKIASGGELSRIMLALKSILAQSDRISVLVFDEIDANIGGRMGTVIGQKLRKLAGSSSGGGGGGGGGGAEKPPKGRAGTAAPSRHQVLCITHLPQIAAFADRHLRIAKSVAGKGKTRQTSIAVTPLEGKERIEELAEMLAGKDVTDTTRRQVEEMLETATT